MLAKTHASRVKSGHGIYLHSTLDIVYDEIIFLKICIRFAGFMILMYIFETYLDIRQHRALKLPTLPKPLVGVISGEKFERSRAYSLDKRYV